MNFSLIVTDSGPLITLAIAGSLDVLFLPNLLEQRARAGLGRARASKALVECRGMQFSSFQG